MFVSAQAQLPTCPGQRASQAQASSFKKLRSSSHTPGISERVTPSLLRSFCCSGADSLYTLSIDAGRNVYEQAQFGIS